MHRHLIALADGVVRLGALVGGVAMWLITAIVAFDVVARFFGSPTLWALEICTYLMIAIALTGAGDALKHDAHFAVTLLVDAMRPLRRAVVEIATSIIALAFYFILAYGGVLLVAQAMKYDMKSPTLLKIPLIYPTGLVVAGAVTLVLAGGLRIRRLVLQARQQGAE